MTSLEKPALCPLWKEQNKDYTRVFICQKNPKTLELNLKK